jgi:phosphoribosyl 1,2-cyclic phosphodiesterase
MSEFGLTIVGAGSSSSTPMLKCLLSNHPCPQCQEASELGYASPNHRLNPSMLLQVQTGGVTRNLFVDPGKTFRESAIKVLRPLRVQSLDAVIITHDHADACWGVDDLREFGRPGQPLDVYCDDRTMASMQRVYPYLFPLPDAQIRTTFVANIRWVPLPDFFDFYGVSVRRVPVFHGTAYENNGFIFENQSRKALYIGDISDVPESSKSLLQEEFDVAVVDMLSETPYPTHFSKDEAIRFASTLKAKSIRFVGMSHSLSFEEINTLLDNMLPNARLGRDGETLIQLAHATRQPQVWRARFHQKPSRTELRGQDGPSSD